MVAISLVWTLQSDSVTGTEDKIGALFGVWCPGVGICMYFTILHTY